MVDGNDWGERGSRRRRTRATDEDEDEEDRSKSSGDFFLLDFFFFFFWPGPHDREKKFKLSCLLPLFSFFFSFPENPIGQRGPVTAAEVEAAKRQLCCTDHLLLQVSSSRWGRCLPPKKKESPILLACFGCLHLQLVLPFQASLRGAWPLTKEARRALSLAGGWWLVAGTWFGWVHAHLSFAVTSSSCRQKYVLQHVQGVGLEKGTQGRKEVEHKSWWGPCQMIGKPIATLWLVRCLGTFEGKAGENGEWGCLLCFPQFFSFLFSHISRSPRSPLVR